MVTVNHVFHFFDKSNYASVRFNIEVRKKIISRMLNGLSGKRILDIGCGDGSISLNCAADNDLTLIDGSESMLNLARENASRLGVLDKVRFIRGDFFSVLEGERFDIILCIGVFAHVSDSGSLLNTIRVRMSPEGVLIIQVTDSAHFRYHKKPFDDSTYGYSLNRTTKSDFFRLLCEHKFKIDNEDKYSWTFFPMYYLPQNLQSQLILGFRNLWPFTMLSSEYIFACTLNNG